MRIIPSRAIELEYHSVKYAFRIVSVVSVDDGFDVVVGVGNDFKDVFKRTEGLARWSHRRFEKFIVDSLEVFLDDD